MKRATVLSCRKSFCLAHSGGLSGEDREPAYSLADNLRLGLFVLLYFVLIIFPRRTGKEKGKKDQLISSYL